MRSPLKRTRAALTLPRAVSRTSSWPVLGLKPPNLATPASSPIVRPAPYGIRAFCYDVPAGARRRRERPPGGACGRDGDVAWVRQMEARVAPVTLGQHQIEAVPAARCSDA